MIVGFLLVIMGVAVAGGFVPLQIAPTSDSYRVYDVSSTAAHQVGLSWTQAFSPTMAGNLTGISVLIRAEGASGARGTASTQWVATCGGTEVGHGSATIDLAAGDPDYSWYTLPRVGLLRKPFAASQSCSLWIDTGQPTGGLTIWTARGLGGPNSLIVWANAPAAGNPSPEPTQPTTPIQGTNTVTEPGTSATQSFLGMNLFIGIVLIIVGIAIAVLARG